MKIYETAVSKPVTTTMIFLAIIVFGIYSIMNLAIDFFPEIDLPAITVVTVYPGADAENVEEKITKPLEDRLSGINDLDKITSQSRDNLSIITVLLQYGTDLNEAANDVRNFIDMAMNVLPEGVERPSVFKFSTSQMPIMIYGVEAQQNYPGLGKLLEDNVVNNLNRIDGVASVMVGGAPERVVYAEIDPKKLEAYNITLDQLARIIQAENLNLPVGTIKTTDMEYKVTAEGEFTSSDQIKDIVVGFQNGRVVKFSDIAVIRDSLKDKTVYESVNGRQGVRLMIMKQSDANTVQVANKTMEELDNIMQKMPSDVQMYPIYDSSENILNSVNNLIETIIFAFIFVSLVVLLFFGRWRSSIVILVTIPIALISGFIYLFLANDTLNLISLSAITIAIGMVVDDAIVVLENITKHIERGSTPREASIAGTNEVWTAVIASTIVIIVVFLPLTMLSGLTGTIFRSLGWIVSITVSVSTLAAISITPMMSAHMLKGRNIYGSDEDNNNKNKDKGYKLWASTIGKALDWLDNTYQKLLTYVLKYKKTTLILAFVIFLGTMALFPLLGTEFLPQADQGNVNANIHLQTGLKLEKTEQFISKLEKIVNERYPEKYIISFSAGTSENASMSQMASSQGSNEVVMTLRLVDREERERTVFDIAEDFRNVLDTMPEVIKYDINAGGGGAAMGNNVEVQIFGQDLDSTMKIANILRDEISKIPGARDVIINRKNDQPTFKIYFDREKLTRLGLTSATVSNTLRNYITGYTASKYREEGSEYDVIVRLNDRARNDIELFKNLMISTPTGAKVSLSEIANIVEESTPPEIEHENKQRVITVSAKPENISLGELGASIQKLTRNIDLPRGVDINVGGRYEDQMESFRDLIILLLVSILLVYISMAAQFESLTMPLLIILAIPFALSGVILALLITGNTLSVNAMLGGVMLIGIAVKNSIILVDFTNLLRDRGLRLHDAVVQAGRSRLRPILMTASTTFLGMLPMALSTGEGSELWSPIGIAVIGGLVFSTLLSLIIVPTAYYTFIRSGSRRKELMRMRKQFSFVDKIIFNNKNNKS
ncbi:MAG: efflux RND transporter permease subunit [Bacteroidales bacterium]|jgi:HAE1 family hydrophobic/amphiphilic exporter-1|nr:efflux RND transporter permease subunit [Bacteroidales bacterium]